MLQFVVDLILICHKSKTTILPVLVDVVYGARCSVAWYSR